MLIVSGVGLALMLGACADEVDEQPAADPEAAASVVVIDGTLKEIFSLNRSSEQLPVGSADEKAGCTHIRFCTTPGTANTITCDTNDQVCSSDARFNECIADADFVCGRHLPMVFDPAIPCPITGVC